MKDNEDLYGLVVKNMDHKGDDEIVSFEEIRSQLKDRGNVRRLYSNIPTLDTLLEGFEPGELIAVSGPRKSGKTTLAQSIDVQFWKQSVKSLWLQYEVTPRQFISVYGKETKLTSVFTPRSMKTGLLKWARDKITEGIAKHGISVVFIDHLHFLFDIGRVGNISLEIGQVVRYLKYLAVQLEITIFLLCHMRKTELDKEPSDIDMRDSSLIAQESDAGLIIWRIPEEDKQAYLKVCYSRRTGTWEKRIPLIKHLNGFLVEKANGQSGYV